MQDSHSPSQKDFSYLDKLSTEELEELIRQDFQLEEAAESDMDMILHVLEVLEKRAKSNEEVDDLDSAWDSFNKNYRPYPGNGTSLFEFDEESNESDNTPIRLAKKVRLPARIASIAAIVTVILLVGTATAQALGYNILNQVARWTQETFGFVSPDSEPIQPNQTVKSLETILQDYQIMDPISPTWIPDGYEYSETTVTETPQYISFFAKYVMGDDILTICINSYLNSDTSFQIYEIQEETEIYVSGGIEHYISQNYEYTRIAWVQGRNECAIRCMLSRDDVEKMIDSIYERN